jgi:hypothetical protein
VSPPCDPIYTLENNGTNVPEFIKTNFTNMTITFGQERAVEIYGMDALFKEYNLTLTATSPSGAINKVNFRIKFNNSLPLGKYTTRERLGDIFYNVFLAENPPVWNDGFPYLKHS